MSGWVKVMNAIGTHPKFLAAGDRAGWLYVCALGYCNEHLTDGFIPAPALTVISPTTPQPKQRAKELVDVGLWVEVEGGWVVHDYLSVQSSAASVRERRQKDADRKARQRDRDGSVRNGRPQGVTP